MTTLPRDFEPGAVVWLYFDFTSGRGVKKRPAIVLSSDRYHRETPDLIVAAVTSKVSAPLRPGDYLLRDWHHAGLNVPSKVKAVIGTYLQSDVEGQVGSLTLPDWHRLQRALREAVEF